MDIKERLTINEVIDHKKNSKDWKEAAAMVVEEDKVEEIANKSQKEYLRRLEEEQYIHSLS